LHKFHLGPPGGLASDLEPALRVRTFFCDRVSRFVRNHDYSTAYNYALLFSCLGAVLPALLHLRMGFSFGEFHHLFNAIHTHGSEMKFSDPKFVPTWNSQAEDSFYDKGLLDR
jgi:hypothetical protein